MRTVVIGEVVPLGTIFVILVSEIIADVKRGLILRTERPLPLFYICFLFASCASLFSID